MEKTEVDTKLKWSNASHGSYAKGIIDSYEIAPNVLSYYLEIGGVCVCEGSLRACKDFAQDREQATIAKSLARRRIRMSRPTSTGLPREDEM